MQHTNQPRDREDVIRSVRSLLPRRALSNGEARFVAERQAQRLTELLDLGGPITDLDTVTDLPTIEVRRQGGLPVSGFSEWSRGRWLVAINEDDHWSRQRFTLAHELKHILDHPYIEVLYPGGDGKPSHVRAEGVCDYFAACVLMPRPALKKAWGNGNQRVEDLAAHFGVSRAAMGLRLHQLGLTSGRPRCGQEPRRRRYERAPAPSFAFASAPGSGPWI